MQSLLTPLTFVNLVSAPASPNAGETYFDTTLGQVRIYNGTAWVNLGVTAFSTSFGNGAATSFTITHGLGTKDVSVYVYQVGSPFQQIFPDVYNTTTTTVTISGFTAPPATNSLRAVVTSIGGGTNLSYVPVAGGTMTGELVVPDVKVSGLPGATAASRYVGATTSGPPTTGTFAVGDYIIDQTGTLWTCVIAGTPGTWLPGGSGVELAYAELATDPAAIGTTQAAVSGLAITFTAPARSVMLELHIPLWTTSATTVEGVFLIYDAAETAVAEAWIAPMQSATNGMPYTLKSHLPKTGTGGYALTVGTSYTFHVEAVTLSGTIQMTTTSGVYRPFFRAVTC